MRTILALSYRNWHACVHQDTSLYMYMYRSMYRPGCLTDWWKHNIWTWFPTAATRSTHAGESAENQINACSEDEFTPMNTMWCLQLVNWFPAFLFACQINMVSRIYCLVGSFQIHHNQWSSLKTLFLIWFDLIWFTLGDHIQICFVLVVSFICNFFRISKFSCFLITFYMYTRRKKLTQLNCKANIFFEL